MSTYEKDKQIKHEAVVQAAINRVYGAGVRFAKSKTKVDKEEAREKLLDVLEEFETFLGDYRVE